MRVFVIGRVGRLRVGTRLVVREATMGRELFSNKPVEIGASIGVRTGFGNSESAPLVRGKAVESKDFYARVLPPDAEDGLRVIDEAIKTKEAEVAALYKERQAYLAAHVARGERITTKLVKEK